MKEDAHAVAVLAEVLREAGLSERSSAGNERYMATRALGRIGPAARAVVPALLDLRHDEDPDLRRAAAEALARIDPGAAADRPAP
jgi:HEAT repeat protein